MGSAGHRLPGGSREKTNTFMAIVCAYTPTAKAPNRLKQSCFDDRHDVLDRVPQADVLILLDDFNAQVGKRDPTKDLWQGILGAHGLDEHNQAGEEFLDISAPNHHTVWIPGFRRNLYI